MADTSSDVAGFISDKTTTAIQQTWVNGKWVNLADTNQRNNMQASLNKVGEQVEEQQAGIKTAQQAADNAFNQAQTTNDALVKLQDGSTSTLVDLANDILARVKTDDLISQINIASDNILIQSGKLYLDAASVVFGGTAFITDAMITSLNADKITAGTIKGNLIQASSITAEKLSLNMLQLVNDTLATVTLSANQISFSDSSKPDGVRVAIDGNGLTMNDFTSDNAPVASFGVRQLGSTGIYGVMLDFAKDIPNEFFALSKEGTAYQANPQNSVMLWTNTMDKLANAEMGFNFYDYVSFHNPLVIKDKVYNSWGDKSFHLENFNSAGIGILNDAGAGICLGNNGHLYLINNRKYTDVVTKWSLPS